MCKCPGAVRVLGSLRSPDKSTGGSGQRAMHQVRTVGRGQMAQDLVDSDVGFPCAFKCNMRPLEDFKQEQAMV